jgi:small subunit ribosomal protein S15
MINKEKVSEIVRAFGNNEKDTGSVQVQIALLNERIREIAAHLKSFPKDFHSRHGLLKLVGRRRRYLAYFARDNKELYDKFIDRLQV